MGSRGFQGNPPGTFDSLLGIHPDGWQLFLMKTNSQVLSLKLVAVEAKPDKANYWLMYSLRMGRIIKSRDAGLLAEHRPELYDWAVKLSKEAAVGRAAPSVLDEGFLPDHWEQMPHTEVDDESGETWALVMLMPAGWPWVNVKAVHVEGKPRPGRANLTLAWSLSENRWAENQQLADLLSDSDLGEPFIAKVKERVDAWVLQYPHLFPELEMFS